VKRIVFGELNMKGILFFLVCLYVSSAVLQADEEMDKMFNAEQITKEEVALKKERVSVAANIASSKCNLYCNAPAKVNKCTLYPPLNKVRKCALLYAKARSAGRVHEQYAYEVKQGKCEKNAKRVEVMGEKIMLAIPMPNNKKSICGNYLKCLRSYVSSLPTTNILIGLKNFSDDGSLHVKQKYLEIEAFCSNDTYTITLTRVKNITQNNLNQGLKATEPERIWLKEVSKRVIFINRKRGTIKNVPLVRENYSVRTGYRQAYDDINCKVYLEALEKKEDRDLNRAVVRVASSTPNKRFNGKTRLIFDIMDVEPMIEMDWYNFAHYDPTFSKKGTYVKTNIVSKRLFGDPEWYEKMRYVVKKAGEAHIDTRCSIEDAKEFARGYWTDSVGYKLSYDYDINIRPATMSEIKQARDFLKNMKYRLKDRRLYKTLNSTKGIYEWIKNEKNKKNQEKLKKKMDKEIDLFTD
jgi:hypothetical protein